MNEEFLILFVEKAPWHSNPRVRDWVHLSVRPLHVNTFLLEMIVLKAIIRNISDLNIVSLILYL